jgi:hypothetical protein
VKGAYFLTKIYSQFNHVKKRSSIVENKPLDSSISENDDLVTQSNVRPEPWRFADELGSDGSLGFLQDLEVVPTLRPMAARSPNGSSKLSRD